MNKDKEADKVDVNQEAEVDNRATGQFADLEPRYPNLMASTDVESSINFATDSYNNVIEFSQNEGNTTVITNDMKVQKLINVMQRNMSTRNQETSGAIRLSEGKTDSDFQQKSERRTARIIGGALLLMAVLAGISIPALGTLTASIGLVGIFLLDIMVSFGILEYHKKQKPKLAKTSSLLRLLYTAILGVGIGYLFAGSVPMFNKIWGLGLIAFGLHLITLGLLFNNEGGKKWVNIMIKSLLIIAGIGYLLWYVGILVVPNPVGFAALMESIFILPMILGEVFYALWMLLKGGKLRN